MNTHFNGLRLRTVSAVVAMALAASSAWAVDPFTVRDIRLEGLQRVEPGTVFASLPFRVGETYNDEKGSAAIRSLFALGLFKDVRLETNGDVLVVIDDADGYPDFFSAHQYSMVSSISVPSPGVDLTTALPPWRSMRPRIESRTPRRSSGIESMSKPRPRS